MYEKVYPRIWARILLLILFSTLCSCNPLSRLRAVFHPEEVPQGTDGDSTLQLEITPNENLTIYLDQTQVGTQSPYTARFLKAGTHRVKIVSPGHVPFLAAFELQEGSTLHLPIALRPQNAEPKSTSDKVSMGPELDPSLSVQTIVCSGSEAQKHTRVDGQNVPPLSPIKLPQAWGTLQLGEQMLVYRYNDFGELDFILLDNPHGWTRTNTEQTQNPVISPGQSIKSLPVILNHQTEDGQIKTISIQLRQADP